MTQGRLEVCPRREFGAQFLEQQLQREFQGSRTTLLVQRVQVSQASVERIRSLPHQRVVAGGARSGNAAG